jgi:hypothetical protein
MVGARAVLEVIWRYQPPKLVGEVISLRHDADFDDALAGNDRSWLLAYIRVHNSRPKPTSIKGWEMRLRFEDGRKKTLVRGPIDEKFWEKLRLEHQPPKRPFIQTTGMRFEHGASYEGWVGFACEPLDSDAVQFTISAVDVNGKEHVLKPYERESRAPA